MWNGPPGAAERRQLVARGDGAPEVRPNPWNGWRGVMTSPGGAAEHGLPPLRGLSHVACRSRGCVARLRLADFTPGYRLPPLRGGVLTLTRSHPIPSPAISTTRDEPPATLLLGLTSMARMGSLIASLRCVQPVCRAPTACFDSFGKRGLRCGASQEPRSGGATPVERIDRLSCGGGVVVPRDGQVAEVPQLRPGVHRLRAHLGRCMV
jgi:hypothetical protein